MAVAVRKQGISGFEVQRLADAVACAREALLTDQQPDGHWCFELEADCTIPAEYVMFLRYLGERRPELEAKIGTYLRSRQAEHGGWPQHAAGMGCGGAGSGSKRGSKTGRL